MKENLALQFYRDQNKDFIFLNKTHINHNQIQHIRNNWLGSIFFTPEVSQIKALLIFLHLGLEGLTEVDTDLKRRFVSFKITPSNDRVLYIYAPSWNDTREQLDRAHFFEGLHSYMKNKSEGMKTK